MTYYLIFFIWGTMMASEFNNQAACEAAKMAVEKQWTSDSHNSNAAICVAKGLKDKRITR